MMLLALLALLGLFLKTGNATPEPLCAWSMFAHDPQRTSSSPCPGPSPANVPGLAWAFQDQNLNLVEQPVLSSSGILVFIASFLEDTDSTRTQVGNIGVSNTTLFALNATSGQRLWQRSGGLMQQSTGLTVSGDLLYIFTSNGLQVLNASNGVDVKLLVPHAAMGVLDISRDLAYLVLNPYDVSSTYGGTELAAYNLTTGAEMWNVSIYHQGMFSGPSLGPGGLNIWVFGIAGGLMCIDAITGVSHWNFLVDGPAEWMITVGTYGDQQMEIGLPQIMGITAVDINGKQMWGSPFVGGTLALAPNNLTAYGYTSDGYAQAIDMFSGQNDWLIELGDIAGLIGAPALASDGTLYYSYWANVTAVNSSDGRIVWSFAIPQHDVTVTAPIIGANGMLYVAGSSGTMYALQ